MLCCLSVFLVVPNAVAAPAKPVWYVYRDVGSPENHGAWSNVLPPGGEAGLRIDLASSAATAVAGTAVRLDFDLRGTAGWVGLAVASRAGFWGAEEGPGFDLSSAGRLVFAGRGQNGGERIRVKLAVTGDQPFGDSALLPFDTGWIELTAGWREYHLPVDGRQLTRVITPFVVIANRFHNPAATATVFLDEIRYEPR
jgi:hypothetical protein